MAHGTSKVTAVPMAMYIYLTLNEYLPVGFSVLDAAVVLVIGRRLSGVVLFAPLRVVDEGVELRAEEATEK